MEIQDNNPVATMELRTTLHMIDTLIQALPEDLRGGVWHCNERHTHKGMLAGIQAYRAARWPDEEGFYPAEDFEE